MNDARPPLPGYWHFAWMFFMQPMSLHHRLKATGIEQPDITAWRYWRQRRELSPAYGDYLKRLAIVLLLAWAAAVLPLVTLMAILLWWVQLSLDLTISVVVYALGVGAVFVVLGFMFGVVYWVACAVAFGVMYLGLWVVPAVMVGEWYVGGIGVGLGVLSGVAFGPTLSVAVGIVKGEARGVSFGLLIVGVGLMAGLTVGVEDGVEEGVLSGLACGVVAALSATHVLVYPLECLLQWVLYRTRGQSPARTLRYSPVLFHDLSYLPIAFLARHVVEAAETDPDLAGRVLDACAIAPGQRNNGRAALAELQARELRKLADALRFADALSLQGRWLPGKETDSPLLRAFAEAARFLAAAQSTYLPHLAQRHLNQAEQGLNAIDNLRLQSREPLARFSPETIAAYRRALVLLRQRSAQAAAEMLPNPFITTNPISGDLHWGPQMFRGRETVVRQIEGLLAQQQTGTSLALIGPRRCGKSSLLNMFRRMLPDTQIVLFDLQDNPAATPAAFYRALAERARRQADQDRGLRLPAFPDGPSIEALRAWLDALEEFDAVPRFLICIDEFERLAALFPDEGQDLLQFMGLLRATIQHRRRVRLLVAGAAPFDELDKLWNDHFINLREIRIGHLDRPTSICLLTRPIDEFPAGTIPVAVAEAIVTRSGGQPYLTQLYGSLLVDRLNDEKRKSAELVDLEAVENDVLDQANYYFRNVWSDLEPAAQAVVRSAAQGVVAPLEGVSPRALRRRLIIAESGELLVPVFGRWVLEQEAAT